MMGKPMGDYESQSCNCDECRFITRTKWYGWIGVLALLAATWLLGKRR